MMQRDRMSLFKHDIFAANLKWNIDKLTWLVL